MTRSETATLAPGRTVEQGPAHSGDDRLIAQMRKPLSIVIGLEGLAMGGCPINALDLARALNGRGHNVNIFAINEDVRVSILPYATQAGFSVTVLPTRAGVASRAWQIRRFAARHSADIVHVYAPWLGPSAAIAVNAWPRRAVVVTNWTMENALRTAPHTPMIVGTRRLQREAEDRHASPVWLMEPPVDLESDHPDPVLASRFRSQLKVGANEIAAVIVSRIDRDMKAEGIGYAIRAVAKLDDPRVRLVVVGDGNVFDDVRNLAEEVNDRLGRQAIVLTGAMIDPRPAYAAADFVLGMGGSALRSLAHAKPLIVLGENGFARIFDAESTPHFFELGFFGDGVVQDPVLHLASLMRQLLDRDLREALGEFGLVRVRERFSLDVAAEALEGMYITALQSAPGPATRWAEIVTLLARNYVRRGLWHVSRLARRRPE